MLYVCTLCSFSFLVSHYMYAFSLFTSPPFSFHMNTSSSPFFEQNYGCVLWYSWDYIMPSQHHIFTIWISLLLHGLPVGFLIVSIIGFHGHTNIIFSAIILISYPQYSFRGSISALISLFDLQVGQHKWDEVGLKKYIFKKSLPLFSWKKNVNVDPSIPCRDYR